MDYKYRLVMFLNNKKTKEIDIVPTSWLENDETLDTLLCKFMPEPYTKKTVAVLHEMIKSCKKPLDEWPTFPVDLRGRAHTYEEAEEKAILLEKKPYAYSTDSEKNSKKKATDDIKNFKFKALSSKESLKAQELNKITINLNENLVNIDGLDKRNRKPTQTPHATIPKKGTISRKISLDTIESSAEESRGNTSSESSDSSSSGLAAKDNSQKNLAKFAFHKKKDSPFPHTKEHFKDLNDLASVSPTIEKDSSKGLVTFDDAKKKEIPPASANKNFEDRLFQFLEEKYNSLNYKIGELQGQVINMRAAVNSIQASLEKSNLMDYNIVDTNTNLTEEALNFSLPCQDYDDFNKLDEELTTNQIFRKKMIRQIMLSLNKKSGLRRNLGQIIRQYMTRELALSFVTSKAVTGKHVFSKSKLYMCLKDATSAVFKEQDGSELTEPTFRESVRMIFNNAKDWDGQGNIRKSTAKKI